MTSLLDRRSFLRSSALAAAGSTLTCTALVRSASGETMPRIEPPVVDKLVIRVLVDGQHDIFIPDAAEQPAAALETANRNSLTEIWCCLVRFGH